MAVYRLDIKQGVFYKSDLQVGLASKSNDYHVQTFTHFHFQEPGSDQELGTKNQEQIKRMIFWGQNTRKSRVFK